MIVASRGAVASAPTDSITPSRTTIVPLSITAPATVTIRAPRIAYTSGAAADSASVSPAAAAMEKASRRTSGSPRVALVQRELLVIEADLATGDDHVNDRRAHLQRI